MRNIFLFIRKHFNFLTFIILQGFCIYLIIHYNKYHNAVGSQKINELTGQVNTQYNKVENYLYLKKNNDNLIKQNEQLLNRLKENFENPDTVNRIVVDSIPLDTLGTRRKWLYQRTKVVSNFVITQNNYIVVNRGTNQNLSKDEGVIDVNNGVVGIVTEVSENYSVIMSLLHKDSKISAILKNDPTGGGVIVWDGKEPNYLSFSNVRKSAKAAKGDTVITSGITYTFPAGMIIGVIDEIKPDVSTNNYIIKLKSAVNFFNLQYAYAIKNFQKPEIDTLIQKVKKRESSSQKN